MPTYADTLREMARMLDDDFSASRMIVIARLASIIEQLAHQMKMESVAATIPLAPPAREE